MSDYALVQSVFVEPKGSTLAAAASVSDTVLYVDDAQDFDDEGGTLNLNGATLQYTSLVEGENPDDPDEINLADPLAAAADEDDIVSPLSGGLVPEDWYAIVTMGDDGDVAHIPIDVDQRNQWPVGEYPDPVPVVVSDDLQHILDAPGRTVASRNSFCNTDTYVYDGIAADIRLPLTKIPISGSEQPFWKADAEPVGGQGLPPGTWRIEGLELIVDDAGLMAEFGADDLFWVDYAWDEAAADISRPSEEPFVDSNPIVVGAQGDLSTLVQPGNYDSLVGHFLYTAAQPSETVTSSITGTITSVTIALPASVGPVLATTYAVTGSISAGNLTVRDIELVTFDIPATAGEIQAQCSLDIQAGDFLALHQPSGTTPDAFIGFHSYGAGTAGYGNENGAIPNPLIVGSVVPVVAGGSGGGNVVLIQGRGV